MTGRWWAEFGALLGGIAAIATIHAVVIVPAILDSAELRTQRIVEENNRELRSRYVSRDELMLILNQLDRIEKRLPR